MTTQMSCLFNTPKHSWTRSPTTTFPTNPSLLPHNPSAPHLLLSCFYLPSQWAHTAFGGLGKGGERRGRKVDRVREREGRRESVRPLAVRESAPGWASFLDMLWGAIVLHVSSPSLLMGPVYHHSDYGRWLGLWGWGWGGGDGRSGRNVHVCVRVRYRKKESVLGREVGWRRGLGTEA